MDGVPGVEATSKELHRLDEARGLLGLSSERKHKRCSTEGASASEIHELGREPSVERTH